MRACYTSAAVLRSPRRTRRALIVAVLLFGAAGISSPSFGRAIEWRVVAPTGTTLPGIPPDQEYGVILGDVGADGVVFDAYWGSPDESSAVFRESPDAGVVLVASLDATSLEMNGSTLHVEQGRENALLHSSRIVVDRGASFEACPLVGYSTQASFVPRGTGDLDLVIAPGMPAPGIEGWILTGAAGALASNLENSAPALNADGDLAFFALIVPAEACGSASPTPYAVAVFGPDGSDSYTLVALPNGLAPGAPGGAVMTPTERVEIDGTGGIAFAARVRLGPSGPTVDAIYRWDATNGIALAALANDLDRYGATGRFGGWQLGGGGHLAFTTFDSGALFVESRENGVQARARRGDPAPGLSDDFHFAAIGFDFMGEVRIAVNAIGDVAFPAYAAASEDEGPYVSGIWGPDAAGALVPKLVDGQQAPHFPDWTIARSSVLALNERRDLLVEAYLAIPDEDPFASRLVYYLIDAHGDATLLLYDGEILSFAPGDSRPIALISPPRYDAALESFAFDHHASGETVIFHTTVPEPGSAVQAVGILIVVAFRAACRRAR